jgi:hypothetical protein
MKPETNEKIVDKLFDAIECVREDVAKVEFWASAITGFAQPVPHYQPGDISVWMPPEQAATLSKNTDR